MTDRLGRVDELIKREISVIILDDIEDPLVRRVTITKVEVSKDLAVARIFYVVYGSASEKESVARGLKRAARFIRGRLARKVSLKVMPQMSFREDKSEEREQEIEKLFDLLDKERGTDKGSSGGQETEGAHDE